MANRKPEISWGDFSKLDLRVGTVERAEPFPEARKPAIKLWLNFGQDLGVLKTSAQITDLYEPQNVDTCRPYGACHDKQQQ